MEISLNLVYQKKKKQIITNNHGIIELKLLTLINEAEIFDNFFSDE